MTKPLGVWFPAVRTGTGTDVFTERMVEGLRIRGIRAEATWLPLRAEYAPWLVQPPEPPEWATVAHINTWLHHRFIPRNIPVIATVHHAVHHPEAREYKGWLRSSYHKHWIIPIEKEAIRRSRSVSAVSQFVADTTKGTILKSPIQVIYNGIDTEKFSPRHQLKKPGTPFRLLYVGSWMARKGVDLLAPIMTRLGQGYELRYTGSASKTHKLKTTPKNMQNIGKLTSQEAVISEMQNSDALLLPSRSEGFGLVAAEAMACGVPVLAMSGSSVDEIIEHGINGFLCKRDSIDAFVNAAQALATTPGLLNSMSLASRESIIRKFTHQEMFNSYIQAYTVTSAQK